MKLFLIRITFCLLILFTWTQSIAQQVLWASKVLGYSSEYRPGKYGHGYRAKQILGEPNKLPSFGDSPCAWTPADADGRNEEWIKVGYAKAIPLKQIAIAENFNPGAIARVYAYDENGKEYLITELLASQQNVPGRMLHLFPKQQNLVVNAVKIVLQPGKISGFNQIDAIGISESQTPVEAKINVVANVNMKLKRENLGKAVNTPSMEVAPIVSPDGKTLYFLRKDYEGNTGRPDTQDVWFSTLNDKGQWNNAVNIGPPINTAGDNAITSLSADGKTAYLINAYRPDGSLYFGFSKSEKTRTGWSFPKDCKLPTFTGSKEYLELSISPFENAMIIALERADTEGAKDLYVSQLQKDNSWSEMRSLGAVINSADDESTPFLSLDNKTLYFASAGHSGYGDYDLFITRRLDDTWQNWSKPENLGPVVNSSYWDAFMTVSAAGDYAYLSSREKSGVEPDIFRIKLSEENKPEPVAILTGNVYEAGTTKSIKSDISITQGDTTFAKTAFDPEGGEYRLILPLKETYTITVEGEGYFPASEELDLSSENGFKTIKKNLYVLPMKAGTQIRLSNAMFLQSSAEVSPGSFSELDKVVNAMKSYPKMEILLEGHTDNQGEVQKNVKLSADRVAEVKKYLLSKGIEGIRIQTKAWGPARPIASNATEQTRQRNRRVEFTILKI